MHHLLIRLGKDISLLLQTECSHVYQNTVSKWLCRMVVVSARLVWQVLVSLRGNIAASKTTKVCIFAGIDVSNRYVFDVE